MLIKHKIRCNIQKLIKKEKVIHVCIRNANIDETQIVIKNLKHDHESDIMRAIRILTCSIHSFDCTRDKINIKL